MMKKIIVSALVAVCLAGGAMAQDQPSQRDKKGQPRMGMMKDLNLSDEQKSQMKAIHEDYRLQMETLKKNEDITVREWKSKMQTIREDHQSKIQNLLTPEQKSVMEKAKKDHKGMKARKGRFHKDGMRHGKSPAKMKADLGLTAEQEAALKQNRTDMMSKLKAIREDQSLSDEQKKAEMRKFREQQQETLKSILTEEQLNKMKQQKPHRQKPVS